MIKVMRTIGKHYDLTTNAGGGTVTVEPLVGKTVIQEANGLPSVVLKYNDLEMTLLLFTTSIAWANGVPSIVTTTNHTNGIIATTTLEWVNGSLASVSKVLT